MYILDLYIVIHPVLLHQIKLRQDFFFFSPKLRPVLKVTGGDSLVDESRDWISTE